MLGQRRRQWANVDHTLGQCLVFAGSGPARYINVADVVIPLGVLY